MTKRFILATALLAGCGSDGWRPADTTSLTVSVRSSVRLEQICADQSTCVASQVRALARSTLCDDESVLVRHSQPTPDAGTQCRAQ